MKQQTEEKKSLLNINWGWRIALLYSGFVVLMLFLVWKTTTVKDDLVTSDYYAKELRYQEQIDKRNRANKLKEPTRWTVKGKEVEIVFPHEVRAKKVNADILFYNPAQAKRDVKISCSADTAGVCLVTSPNLLPGVYQMQIEWTAGGIAYYNEGTINIQ
jgi:hypothetical protein